jgi:protocatechuate 3,4-dioxygenase beta subunit
MARAELALFLCVYSASVFAQPAGRGAISGTVVDASSGDAVRKAVVTVTWQGTPRSWATAPSDGSGGFVFEGLPPGQYALRADKAGLGTANYGANSVRELGDLITLADGETRANLKLRFLHSASISGRVIDPDGEPLAGAGVTILRPGRNLGDRILVNYRGASTNDRGEYKITGIDPGEYYLRCMPNLPPQQGPHEIVVPQYYGGVKEYKDTAPMIVRGGDVVSGIDFHLIAEHAATITGRVTGVPPLEPPSDESMPIDGPMPRANGGRPRRGNGGQMVNLLLMSGDDDTMRVGPMGAYSQGPDYGFEMFNNVPGRYRIQANVRAKDKTYYASQVVDAHEGINEIVLAMIPAVEVKGRLKIEGPGLHPPEGFTVALAPPGSGPRGEAYSSPVAKDGSFAIKEVSPGEWLLNINPNPGGLFEKSVRLGDKDFLFKKIEVPAGLDAPLNIVLSSNTASVEGQVDAGNADARRAGILLEPVGKWHTLTRFFYSAIADDSGKFKLSGVAPGKYKIFALEKIATASYHNPEAGDVLDALGEELEVTEGAKVESHPKLIPLEAAREMLKP